MGAPGQMAKEDLAKEDLPFEVPEFNEDEFVRKELISFRTTVILFVYALLVALVTFFIWRATDLGFLVLFVIAMALGGLLPFIYKLFRIDISHFKRREWIGTMSLHFFFWLGFTLLLSNPPISDNAPPVIEVFGTPSVQGMGQEIRFGAYLGDNEGISGEPTFCIEGEGTNGCEPLSFERVQGEPVWTYTWTPTAEGNFTIRARAADASGQVIEGSSVVKVGNPFPVIDAPSSFDSLSQSLAVRPAQGFRELRCIQYVIDDLPYSLIPPTKDRPIYWRTDPTFPGWKSGANNVTIQAIEQPVYLHNYKLDGGVARSANGTRTIQVSPTFPDLASGESPDCPQKPAPNLAQTPGLGAATLLAAVALLAVGLRARRNE